MKPHEAEKLLGGHAAGILTEAEKTALFSAALAHQELFDALADEEALREMLADPAVRSHLLALLGETGAKRPVPFWRRPATLGLAASLFAMVTTSLVLWQRERPAPSTPALPSAQAETKPAAPAPMPSAPEAKAKRASESTADRMEKPAPSAAPAPPAEPPPPPNRLMKAEAAPIRAAVTSQAGAIAEGAAMADKTEAAARASDAKETLERLPADRALAGNASLAPGAVGAASRAKGIAVPVPAWTLERLEHGNLRLTVTWATGGYLYLLKRTPTGTLSLAPLAAIADATGTTRSAFEFPLEAEDHLDLYLLHRPEADPKTLPPTGAVDGFRQRLR